MLANSAIDANLGATALVRLASTAALVTFAIKAVIGAPEARVTFTPRLEFMKTDVRETQRYIQPTAALVSFQLLVVLHWLLSPTLLSAS